MQDFLRLKQAGKPYDETAYQACLTKSVADVVRQQAETGIDVPSDGEFGKSISWSQYVLERLSGFERRPIKNEAANPFKRGADRTRFAEFYAELDAHDGVVTSVDAVCAGPIKYTGQAELQRDIDNFKAALKNVKVEEAFLPVAAPASVIPDRKNEYYKTEEDLQAAIADAMRSRIQDDRRCRLPGAARRCAQRGDLRPHGAAGDLCGLPALARRCRSRSSTTPSKACRPTASAITSAGASWPGPHVSDVPLKDIVDLILKVKVGAYVIEGANPRHEHEWQVWKNAKLGAGQVLIPGVISHATNVVEHPELVAERIVRLAKVVGRENVIAGTDCGFAQGPFHRRVHPSIMWAKLEALVAGARLASKELWS